VQFQSSQRLLRTALCIKQKIIPQNSSPLPPFSLNIRFRQEYRLERKLLAELDMDASSHHEELSGLFESSRDPTECRHHISRVVVLHNDKIETFSPSEDQDVNNFFDNDSFWSGSITWY